MGDPGESQRKRRPGRLTIVLVGIAIVLAVLSPRWLRPTAEVVLEAVEAGRELPPAAGFAAVVQRRAESDDPQGGWQAFEEGAGAVRVGTIRLDLAYGVFTIRPGQPGEGVRVTGNYAPEAFELIERFEEREDGTWIYRLTFGAKGGAAGLFLRGGEQPENELLITLPPDLPFDLEGDWGIGELEAELGGLWLRKVDLDTGTGAHALAFSAPTPLPLERLQVDKGIGELLVERLGNASPRASRIKQSIGSAQIDLSGAWAIDGEVSLQARIGELAIEAPDRAHLQVENSGVLLGENYLDDEVADLVIPAWAPTVTLRAKLTLGALEVAPPPAQEQAPEAPPSQETEVEEEDVSA